MSQSTTEGGRDGSPSQDPLEEGFLLALIDSVKSNPCIYNRYDPLHKVTDYKHEIWKMISIEIGYDGQPVELERKWKHMRDKYVRLRKHDKQKAPIKETNKWYNYYQKMSFLDPYVEHRNRKRQKDYDGNSLDLLDEDSLFLDDLNVKDMFKSDGLNVLMYEAPLTSSSTSSSGTSNSRHLDSPNHETEQRNKNINLLYNKLLAESQAITNQINETIVPLLAPVAPVPVVNAPPTTTTESRARKRKPIPIQILPDSPPPEKITKEESVDDPAKEDQVNLFIRAITETMTRLDRKQFVMARIEISKVLYDIEFNKDSPPNHQSCK